MINAYHGKGLALFAGGTRNAVKAFDRAIELVPKGSESKFYYLWKYRSLALQMSKKYPEALAAISDAIRLEGQDLPDIMLLNEKASLLKELKQSSNAVEIFTQIIKREDKSWAYYNRGIIKSELGDKKAAISDYDRAISLQERSANGINPQYAKAYGNRAGVKFELGDKKGAISDCDRAIAIDPQLGIAYFNRGLIKFELGDKKGALSDFNRAIAIDPQLGIAYFNRGLIKFELGDKKGALSDYERSLAINPQLGIAYANRGRVKYELGDRKGAIANLNIAAQLFKAQNNRLSRIYGANSIKCSDRYILYSSQVNNPSKLWIQKF